MPVYNSHRYAILNRWDPSHLEKIDRLLDLSRGSDLLEVGCGQGHLTKRLADRGLAVTGIDANESAEMLAVTDRVVHMTAESLEFDDASFDAVVAIHAIEHIPKLRQALSEMARVLRPGGQALYIYPAEPIKGIFAIPTSIILHGTPFKARAVHCHRLWPAKLRRLLQPMGMTERHREFNLVRTPQFVSLFEKAG